MRRAARLTRWMWTCLCAAGLAASVSTAREGEAVQTKSNAKLKVFILVGQSNMQGTGKISTAPHMAGDPKTKPLHDKLMDGDKPRVFNDVRITAISDKDGEKSGP